MIDWIDSEPGAGAIVREMGRLRRRALARPLRTFGITLALVAGVAVWQARKGGPRAAARVILRITEGTAATDNAAPAPARQLRGFIRDVVFAAPNLRAVIEHHHLYPTQFKRDPTLAVEAMREDVDVEVWRNYFLEVREEGDGLRSAHVGIRYTARDPEVALAVVRELGEQVVQTSEANRIAEADEAVRRAQAAIETSRAELQRKQEELVRAEMAQDATHSATSDLEVADLQQAIARVAAEQARRAQRLSDLQMGAQLERGELGLEFAIVDAGIVDRGSGARSPLWLALLALIAGTALLPLVGVAVAAFDRTVDDLDDISRLGLQPLGHVAGFDGDRSPRGKS